MYDAMDEIFRATRQGATVTFSPESDGYLLCEMKQGEVLIRRKFKDPAFGSTYLSWMRRDIWISLGNTDNA